MKDWLEAGCEEAAGGQRYTQPLVPSFQMQIGLAKIIQRILNELCSARVPLDASRRKAHIDALSLDLCRWEAGLDPALQWNKWQATNSSLNPSTAMLQ